MGADGGIEIVEIQNIKDNWQHMRKNWKKDIKEISESRWIYSYEKEELSKLLDMEVPEEYDFEFMKKVTRSCDTPYQLDSYVIFAYGDNIDTVTSNIIDLFYTKSTQVETWT